MFFRAATRERALALGVDGSARNLADGRVEVLGSGAPEALDRLESWLHQGPPAAQVDVVKEQPCPGPLPAGFTTG